MSIWDDDEDSGAFNIRSLSPMPSLSVPRTATASASIISTTTVDPVPLPTPPIVSSPFGLRMCGFTFARNTTLFDGTMKIRGQQCDQPVRGNGRYCNTHAYTMKRRKRGREQDDNGGQTELAHEVKSLREEVTELKKAVLRLEEARFNRC
jgi:hypothetical protein